MRNSRGSTSTATASPFNLKETGCVFATMRSSFARSAFGARRRRLQCAAGHLTAHGGLVGHIPALVGCWITDAHGEPCRLAELGFIERLARERRFRGAGSQGRRSRVGECDGDPRHVTAFHLQQNGRGGGGEVAALAFELPVRPAAACGRNGDTDLSENLIGAKLSLVQPEEIAVCLDGALALGTG